MTAIQKERTFQAFRLRSCAGVTDTLPARDIVETIRNGRQRTGGDAGAGFGAVSGGKDGSSLITSADGL